jgi:hypothetical protein
MGSTSELSCLLRGGKDTRRQTHKDKRKHETKYNTGETSIPSYISQRYIPYSIIVHGMYIIVHGRQDKTKTRQDFWGRGCFMLLSCLVLSCLVFLSGLVSPCRVLVDKALGLGGGRDDARDAF